ncbi:MAG TPA: hypothetical protein VLX91_02265 [Candidatus Acidoferrales bacterium]|nr:hypothetical protein [Candidatus Acidoferrales bacterium]
MNKNALRPYLVYTSWYVFIVIIFFILWPLNGMRTGYFLILAGLAGLAMRPFVPDGLKKPGWTTERQRRDMLWGSLAGIVIGLAYLYIKWL